MKKHSDDFELYGIFGYPLSHTFSPPMQEAGFEALGRKAFYLALEYPLKEFRACMRGLGPRFLLSGFNVTVPYKEIAGKYLDGLEPQAKMIGAVNTVFHRNGKWMGTNTDEYGFRESLRRETQFLVRTKNVVVLGAGGSARAVVCALAKEGAREIVILNRTVEKAEKIAKNFKSIFPKVKFRVFCLSSPQGVRRGSDSRLKACGDDTKIQEVINQATLIVNTTSLGLKPNDPLPLPANFIERATRRKRKIFYDLIYKPAETKLLRLACAKGHRTLNGLSMLLYQGARSFEYWTGKKAPVEVMSKALFHSLSS